MAWRLQTVGTSMPIMTSPTNALALCAVLLCLATRAAHAVPTEVDTSVTLRRMVQTATINLGHRESSVPFSYVDRQRQVVGYSQDLMMHVVDTLRQQLGLPALVIRMVPVTSQNRIALVQNGSVDLECGSTTHNRQRARQVGFSVSIFHSSTRLLTRRDAGIASLKDLAGRRVVVTTGTTGERTLMLYAETSGVKFEWIRVRDHGDAFAMLQSGRGDAFFMDEALLYGQRSQALKPDDWVIVGEPMAPEVYACMFRKDDPVFKSWVDASISQWMRSGAALRTYHKWFQSPLPGGGPNLNWPPPDALLDLYRAPNDRPLD